MKTILEFTSPDDDEYCCAAQAGWSLKMTVLELDQALRDWLKYDSGKPSHDTRKAWETMRTRLHEIAAENGVAWVFE